MKLLESPHVKIIQYGQHLAVYPMSNLHSVSVYINGIDQLAENMVKHSPDAPFREFVEIGVEVVVGIFDASDPDKLLCSHTFDMLEYPVPKHLLLPDPMEAALEAALELGKACIEEEWRIDIGVDSVQEKVEEAEFVLREARMGLSEWLARSDR